MYSKVSQTLFFFFFKTSMLISGHTVAKTQTFVFLFSFFNQCER